MDSFVNHCLSVKKLSVHDIADTSMHIVEALLKATSGKLISLAIDGVHHEAVAMHCVGLLKLEIYLPPKEIASLCRTVGPTLESLTFSGVDVDGIQVIQSSCRFLRSIEVWVDPPSHAAYAECCASYGSQLEVADLGAMPPSLCSQEVNACSNVRCVSQLRAL